MVEVDPLVLFAAGAAVVGVASVLVCTVKPKAPKTYKEVAAAPASSVSAASSKPAEKKKKRKSSNAKKAAKNARNAESAGEMTADETGDDTGVSAAEDVTPVSTSENKKQEEQTAVAAAEAAAVDESDSDDEFGFPMLAKKNKKPKETPEQKAARAERQKEKQRTRELLEAAAAIKQAEEAAAAAIAAAATAAVDSADATPDGWAVVEKRRPNKADEETGASTEHKEGDDKDDKKPLSKKAKAAAAKAEAAAEAAAAAKVADGETAATADEVPPAPELVIDSVTSEMSVDSKKLGLLIGPKGVTKIGIQNATGVEIEMPKTEKDFTGPVTITITGPAAGVGKATAALHELCSKGYCMLLAGPDFQEGYIAVHQKNLPEIIGKGGANIRAIQNHTGCKISTPSIAKGSDANGGDSTPSKVKIGLAGPREQVTECRFIIKELLKYYHTSVTHPGVVHTELDIPSSYYNFIIGSKGSEIKHIQGNYSVSVHIPNADSSHEHVLVVGQPENVAKAAAHIRKLVEKVDALNEKRVAEQAAREAEAAQRAANAAAAREARAAAAAAARGENVDSGAPVAYSIGGGSNLAQDKNMRRRKNDDDERVPGDEWMDNFAPPSKSLAISSMLPSQFAGTDSDEQASAAAPVPAAAASPPPGMEFPTPAEVRQKSGKGGAAAAAAVRAAPPAAAAAADTSLEEGEVVEESSSATAPASSVWNKN